MAFARWERPIVDGKGNVLPGAYVTVRREMPGFPLAVPLYGDFGGTFTIDNPITADANGMVAFHVVGGFYRLDVVAPGFSHTLRNVALGTAAATDIDVYSRAGFTWAPESATTAPPAAPGCMRADNEDLVLAGHLFVHSETLSGANVLDWLLAFAPGLKTTRNRLLLATGDSREASWEVLSAAMVGDYVDLSVAAYTGPDTLALGDGGFVTLSQQLSGSDGYMPGYRLAFSSSTTDSDPGAGTVRFGHASFGSISYLFIDNLDAGGASIADWLDGLDDVANAVERARLRFEKADDPTVYAEFSVIGAVVDGGGYRKVPVAPVAGGIPANGAPMVATASKSGADGAGDMSSSSYPDITAIEALSGTGVATRTSANAWALRSIDGTADEIVVTNPAGVAGNPSLALAARAKLVVREFPLLGWSPPGSNYMTLDTRNFIPVFDADTSTQETIYAFCTVPETYAGGGLTFAFEAMATSATGGTLGWDVAVDKLTGKDNDSFSFATAKTATAVTVPASSGEPIKYSVSMSNSEIDGAAAGDHLCIRFRRDVANDNASGDGELMFLSARGRMT